ncbi:uncharacterized protein E5676_scaffold2119G00490 [Cucumis melo var. makuwa]|uniref:Integrase catalytic domain-containing protein n=1 Tax=Cucumis melo var. makuwa TaxID=1194695 RepID=A0A5A7VHS5_CUCMM|nr:uncharacterized protein E6C27_scaffold979G001000 [Cucumis melo var. makuwa]TYK04111.1 uncharacterized protein E5676_scaffold2119G00490 [Cucumis melo var. makuwa]
MVIEEIVLGHKIFYVGSEVDPIKIDVLSSKVTVHSDHKGNENQVANHLSRLHNEKAISDIVPEYETIDIVTKCHEAPYGGHFAGQKTVAKVLQNILLAINYVSKWVEAIFCTNAIIVSKFLKRDIFTRFGTPRTLISDEGSHFINRIMAKLFGKYNITHKVATAYHP